MSYPKYKNKHLEEALFHPKDANKNFMKKHKNLPKKYILVYEPFVLRYFKRKYRPKKIPLNNEKSTLYVYKDIGFIQIYGIGSPCAVGQLENLIALGGKVFINIGFAGGLHKEGIMLCKKSLRDEGTSYHYSPHGHYAYPDKNLTKKLGELMKKKGLKYFEGISWTTDAYYRETKKEVEKYSKKGISSVEMESSALSTVANIRGVKIAHVFSISDVLGNEWKPKMEHFDVRNGLKRLVDVGVEVLE